MNRFQRKTFRVNGVWGSAAAVLLIFGVFIFGIDKVSNGTKQQELVSLQEAVQRQVVQCYALEGRYPESTAYLEEHYGLTYNKEKYLIDYEIIGSNMMPDITVLER